MKNLKLFLILLFPMTVWAIDVPKIVRQHENTPFEQIVADTFTDDEFIQWLEVRDRMSIQEKEHNDQQLACVAKGINPKTCVDPHWCLYPDKLNTNECSWYRVKYKL